MFLFFRWTGIVCLPNLGYKTGTNPRLYHVLETKDDTFFGIRLFRNAE